MTDASPSPESAPAPPAPRRRKGPPAWGVALFVAALVVLVWMDQRATEGGPPIPWIENDLEAAKARVDDDHPRIFLYIYEPNSPQHAENEWKLFSKKLIKDELKKAVPVRVVADRDRGTRDLATHYGFTHAPLFLVLLKDGNALPNARFEGTPSQDEFWTRVAEPIFHASKPAHK